MRRHGRNKRFYTIASSLLLLTATVHAQAISDAGIVARITADLLPLKSVLISGEALRDEVYLPAELQSLVTYGQNKVIQSLRKDLFQLQYQHKEREDGPASCASFFSPDEGYKLTTVLAGKDLTEGNLKPLVEGIVGMAVSAIEHRDFAAFRDAAEKTWGALQALGVSDPDLGIVVDALFRGAKVASSPPVRLKYE
jgi:hypothetical protein